MDDPFERLEFTASFLFIDAPVGDTISLIAALLSMLVLLVCSALISGSEVAYFSLSPTDHEEIKNKVIPAAAIIDSLLERPKRLLATILITNNFVNIAIVVLSTFITDELIAPHWHPQLKFALQVVVVTFMLLLLGEVIPKIYANKKPLKLANLMAYPIYYLRTVLSPFSYLLVNSTNFIDKRVKKKGHQISVDELSHALELTSEENHNEEDQKILEGIVKFGNTDVKQVMTARVDVISLEQAQSFAEVKAIILDSGFSRIPVHEENFDNIKGILYIKDLLPHLEKSEFNWQKLIRKPYFVPENKKIDDLLREFQNMKTHLAIVVDEYGGSSGIITLEDILEEIVGDISDEFDDDELVYSKLDDHTYVFEGKVSLKDMYRVIEIEGEEFEAEKGESETLAGFVLELFGKIPKKNEKIKFKDYLLTIDAADKRRIKRVKITIPEAAVDEKV